MTEAQKGEHSLCRLDGGRQLKNVRVDFPPLPFLFQPAVPSLRSKQITRPWDCLSYTLTSLSRCALLNKEDESEASRARHFLPPSLCLLARRRSATSCLRHQLLGYQINLSSTSTTSYVSGPLLSFPISPALASSQPQALQGTYLLAAETSRKIWVPCKETKDKEGGGEEKVDVEFSGQSSRGCFSFMAP